VALNTHPLKWRNWEWVELYRHFRAVPTWRMAGRQTLPLRIINREGNKFCQQWYFDPQTYSQQISSSPSQWLHIHYLLQKYTFLQTCRRIYFCCLFGLPNELHFHQAALTNILWSVFRDVITEDLNITCNDIWNCGFEKTPCHTNSCGTNRLKPKHMTYCNVCWETKRVDFQYGTWRSWRCRTKYVETVGFERMN